MADNCDCCHYHWCEYNANVAADAALLPELLRRLLPSSTIATITLLLAGCTVRVQQVLMFFFVFDHLCIFGHSKLRLN